MRWLLSLFCRHRRVRTVDMIYATGRGKGVVVLMCTRCHKVVSVPFGGTYAKFMKKREQVF